METRWGKRLGRYEIVAELGRGTMGIVYKARDPKIDRFVAVKAISVLTQDSDEERQYRERFFYEAQAAGRLLHPGIVTVFDVGEDAETKVPYIVMEYVQGRSLKQVCGDAKTLPLDQALRLTEELAEALDHAHAQGVIHRDIKPANILITEDGHAKIADFGIAKANVAHLTLPGHVIGTPAFMSPEQLQDEAVDGRSDLFSLGVVLYSMITGYSPFQGNSAITVCFKVANRDPLPATSFDPSLPPELDAIMSRAMAKEPAERYQRGIEFALDIRELRQRCDPLSSTGTSTVTQTSRARALPGSRSPLRRQLRHLVKKWDRIHSYLWQQHYVVSAILVLAVCLIAVVAKGPIKPVETTAVPVPEARKVDAPVPEVVRAAVADSASQAPVEKTHTLRQAQKHPAKQIARPDVLTALEIQIRHHFTAATLSVYVDEHLAYSQALRGESKKRLVVLHGIDGYVTATVQVPTGNHRVRVQVQSDEGSLDESKTIAAHLDKDNQKILWIEFDNHNREMRIALR